MTRTVLAMAVGTVLPGQEAQPDKRLRHTVQAFEEIMKSPDKGIPQQLLDKSACVDILPQKKNFTSPSEFTRSTTAEFCFAR